MVLQSQKVVNNPIIFRTLQIGVYGQIRKSDIGEALAALKDLPVGSPVRLRINSPGGEVFTALTLAMELEKHDTTIEIVGNCHSACAQILLYSAKKIKFETGANVIFHTTPISWVQYNLEEGRETDRQYMHNSLVLLNFYRRHLVPLNLVDCGAIAQAPFGPTIIAYNSQKSINDGEVVAYTRRVSREGFYVRKQDLARLFPQQPILVGSDNLEAPRNTLPISSIDQCSEKMSENFAKAISALDEMPAP
jgi:ATP-dependent protease ClpP protease subunit